MNREKPVLVFIHGYRKTSSCWNVMNEKAVSSGYRTAFVNCDSTGSIRKNSRTVAFQIKQVLCYYNTTSVVCICHSKGGIDLQGAILYYGIGPVVRCAITLGTPHYGSPLADVVCALSRLPFLCHLSNPALEDMCTRSMQKFRHVYDSNESCMSVPFFTIAGNGSDGSWCRFLVEMFLNRYGPNDGLVVTKHAMKPNAVHLATVPYSHERMVYSSILFILITNSIRTIR